MNIFALDLSLTATGIASPSGVEVLTPPKACAFGTARLRWIRAQVLDRLRNDALVVVEGYAYARANQAHQLGELGGCVRVALADAGIPYVDIPPACRAKYATGKGNAGKPEVLAAAIRRLGYTGHDNNAADALWLRAMALDHYGAPIVKVPESHRAALETIQWPGIEENRDALHTI